MESKGPGRSAKRLRHHMLMLVEDGRARLERGEAGSVLFPDNCWLLLPGEGSTHVLHTDWVEQRLPL